ncbi:hypothetical protein [Catenulispora subtropica]|uniref:hypothetical protein n=1 Tax=Catenulispora subtropica TaxID=450798 RepID=UPI0031D9FAE3
MLLADTRATADCRSAAELTDGVPEQRFFLAKNFSASHVENAESAPTPSRKEPRAHPEE